MAAILTDARRLGFLGPGPVAAHVALAEALAEGCSRPPQLAVDLGSGGGVPGLVLAQHWPASRWILLDSNRRRTDFLDEAIGRLGMRDRVTVERARAEDVGREPDRRGRADLVVARGFGPPAVTAECAAPLLRVGGRLVVTEPPGAPATRWPPLGLDRLGLQLAARHADVPAWVALVQVEACPAAFPRRVGLPGKRPLWRD